MQHLQESLVNKIEVLFKIFICIVIGLISFTAYGQDSYGSAFLHMVDTSNSRSSLTRIDNPLTNLQPEKALFVTPTFGKGTYVTNDHPIAVTYFNFNNSWHIGNADGSAIAPGSAFNILALPRNHPNVYIHQNKNRGQTQIYTGSFNTRLRHPKLDGKPNAKFIVTQHWPDQSEVSMQRNETDISVMYSNGYWYINNKDKSIMPRNSIFNIYISDQVFTSDERPNSTRHIINNEDVNSHPERFLFVTANSEPLRPMQAKNTGLFYQDLRISGRPGQDTWQVINQDQSRLANTVKFNILPYDPLQESNRYRVYKFENGGITREYSTHQMLMYDPSTADNGEAIALKSIKYNKRNKLILDTKSLSGRNRTGIVDYGYRHNRLGKTNVSKFLQNRFGQNIGLFTTSDDKKVTVRLDYNLDGVIDHMAIHDGIAGTTKIFTIETEEALRNLDELLKGRNTFCLMGQVTNPTTGVAMPGLGITADPKNSILGCGGNGMPSGGGIPSFDTFGNSKEKPADFMDNFCMAVFQNTSSSFQPGLEMAGGWVGQLAEGITIVAAGVAAAATTVVSAPVVATVLIVGGVIVAADALIDGFEEGREASNERVASRLDQFARSRRDEALAYERDARSSAAAGDEELAEIQTTLAEEKKREAEEMERQARNLRDSPIPTPETGTSQYDWNEYCENRAAMHDSYGLDSLEKGMAQMDCPSPVEHVSGIAMSGGGGGPRPRPNGPYQPNLGKQLENALFCPNQNNYPSLSGLLADTCQNPVAQPGIEGGSCGTIKIGTDAGTLEIGAADIMAPKFAKDVKEMLDQVVNPGGIRR